ncbi:MAG: sigma-54-dependent Fis family transcriptional regulator [Brachymonas sp.]|nr:sigma-54-dependent Fis family transcriptional regulator [Brachymonas sp.]
MTVSSQFSPADERAEFVAGGRVLVIDDEPDLRTLYELSLAREGYEVVTAGSVAQSLQELGAGAFHAVVSDMQLPDGLGLEVLRHLSSTQRGERCVVITAHGSAENAVEALKAGAFDYLTKPVDLKQFRSVVAQAVRLGRQAHRSKSSQDIPMSSLVINNAESSVFVADAGQQRAQAALSAIVGSSEVMTQLRSRIAKVARSMAPVLIQGESGTGKELVARAIHACSHRSEGSFVAVNCGAIPEHLLEAEFFGARKGSYTGAQTDRIGFFQAAQGGTLFLDEVGDLPMAMQAKLLRAIQERCIRALGDTQELPVNVRIVSATHRNLAAMVAEQQFRQDLFYRLNVIDIGLAPLRERMDDLPELVASLLARIAQESQLPVTQDVEPLLVQLQSLSLPGNVRELENLLHRAFALSDGQSLLLDIPNHGHNGLRHEALEHSSVSHIPAQQAGHKQLPADPAQALPQDLQAHLDEQERQIIVRALRDTGFNRTAAAARLGMSLRQIRYRMSRLGIEDRDAAA